MDELPCYCDSGEILFKDGDSEDAWDDEERYERPTDGSATVEANSVELEASSMDEFPCYNGRGAIIFEIGYGEKECSEACNRSGPVNEKDNESGNTCGTVKETHADATLHISEEFAHSIDKTSDKQFRWFEEYGQQDQREPPSPELDHAQPFHLMNSLARKASSMNSLARKATSIVTCFSVSETGDRDVLTLIDENVPGSDWQRGKKLVIDKKSITSGTVKETHMDAHPCADYAQSINENSHEQFGWSEPYGMQDQRDPLSPGLDYAQPFGFMNQPTNKASSIVDGDVLTLIDEDASELDQPKWKMLSSKISTGKDKELTRSSFIPQDIEVIDLLSPSPECRIRSGSKKGRVSPVNPVIIDLT
ncbi:unnamed protein product [Dovyalis caffra]|uniref:Uncharacterized protein n=1 Tax=Dovyalis caffra TaxID=77055 RepID=A0AAV1QP56_9ROSI|nr:unnamed protein product [Dovyalis caffra]